MFTGIISAVGTLESIEQRGAAARLRVAAGDLDLSDVQLGDSIAVSGPCLTVVAFDEKAFEVDVSAETLARTTLGERQPGDGVNLEKALRLADRLGGHLVSGHVDGLGEVREVDPQNHDAGGDEGGYVRFVVGVSAELARYLAFKGSICVDGVSLTVNAADDDSFEILIIPHTLDQTTLGRLRPGSRVNLEVDLIARYVERLVAASDA